MLKGKWADLCEEKTEIAAYEFQFGMMMRYHAHQKKLLT